MIASASVEMEALIIGVMIALFAIDLIGIGAVVVVMQSIKKAFVLHTKDDEKQLTKIFNLFTDHRRETDIRFSMIEEALKALQDKLP